MTYPEDVRRRVMELGYPSITKFLERIKFAQGHGLMPHIRPNGFRRGSEKEYERQRSTLAHRLAGIGADQPAGDHDWDALSRLWAAWSNSAFENGDVARLATECVRTSNKGGADEVSAILEALRRLAEEKRASREDIALFSQFAPFELGNVEQIINVAPDSAGLEYAKVARQLPQRIEALEQRLTAVANSANSLAKSSATLKDQPAINARVSESLEDIAVKASAQRDELDGISASVLALEKAVSDIRAVQKKHDASRDSLDAGSAVAEVRRELFELARRVDETVAELHVHIEHAQASGPSIGRPGVDTPEVAISRDSSVAPSTRKCAQLHDPAKGVADAEDLSSTVIALRDNLQSMGLTYDCAQQVAHEVLAAVLCGQLVSFAGSLSLMVAQICAISLVADEAVIVDTPIGLSDTSALASVRLESGVILDNANVGSFELYGSLLRSRIVESQFVPKLLEIKPLHFATLAAPPLGLSIERALSQLGPIVDTDALVWSELSFRRPIRAVRGNFKAGRPLETEARDLWLDLKDELSKVDVGGSELWRRVIVNAYSALQMIPRESEATDADGVSICASWIVPHLLASGIAARTVAQILGRIPSLSHVVSNPRIASAVK